MCLLSFASTTLHTTPCFRYDLGTRFRQKYVLRQNLFRDIPPINISDHVRVHTSNLHRTLFTASALIRGMFPSTPHFFNYYTDRLDVNMEKVDEHLRKSGQTLGIGIQVESQVTNDELFHQIKTASERAKEFKLRNVLDCEFMKNIQTKTKEWEDLANKLFEMTQESVFDPSKNTLMERIAKFKVVANQIRIARAHNMPAFPNRKLLSLSKKEEDMVFEAVRTCSFFIFIRTTRQNQNEIRHEATGNTCFDQQSPIVWTMVSEMSLQVI